MRLDQAQAQTRDFICRDGVSCPSLNSTAHSKINIQNLLCSTYQQLRYTYNKNITKTQPVKHKSMIFCRFIYRLYPVGCSRKTFHYSRYVCIVYSTLLQLSSHHSLHLLDQKRCRLNVTRALKYIDQKSPISGVSKRSKL